MSEALRSAVEQAEAALAKAKADLEKASQAGPGAKDFRALPADAQKAALRKLGVKV